MNVVKPLSELKDHPRKNAAMPQIVHMQIGGKLQLGFVDQFAKSELQTSPLKYAGGSLRPFEVEFFSDMQEDRALFESLVSAAGGTVEQGDRQDHAAAEGDVETSIVPFSPADVAKSAAYSGICITITER